MPPGRTPKGDAYLAEQQKKRLAKTGSAAPPLPTPPPKAKTQPVTTKTKNPDLGAQVPLPNEGPTHVPALQDHGVQQDITTTNHDVQQIVDAHKTKFGYDPSPGLVFDLLKSKPLVGPDWSILFKDLPANQRSATATKLTAADAPYKFHPDNTYVRQNDGLLVRAYYPNNPNMPPPTTVHELHKEYPTVQAGMLPIGNAEDVYKALDQLAGGQDNMKVADAGQSFEQARKLEEQRTGSVVQAYEHAYHARMAVRTLVDAQTNLNKMMGTKLPVTGFFNPDWEKALSNWMKSRDYFERAAQFQAKQAGFKEYDTYLKAFTTKRNLVHGNPALAQFLNSLPLYAFAHGGSVGDVTKALALHPYAGVSKGHLVDLVNPMFDVSTSLHALTRSAGVLLDVVGGTVNQGKAYAQAGNAFTNAIEPKWLALGPIAGSGENNNPLKNFDKAKENARKQLTAHPSWLKIFAPQLDEKIDSKNSPEWLKAVDELTNFAGDLIILRKATFTGETVRAGDVAGIESSTYAHRASAFAYQYLKEGKIGRARAILEPSPGSERLASAAAPAVKRGRMTAEQFHQHVKELFRTGETTIRTLPKEKEGVIDVFHGTKEPFASFDVGKSAPNQHGKVAYVSDNPEYASSYAVAKFGAEAEGEAPNVRLYRLQTKTIFDLTEREAKVSPVAKSNVKSLPHLEENEGSLKVPPPGNITKVKTKVLAALTPEERKVIPTMETVSWDGIKDNKDLYDFLAVMGSAMEHDAGAAVRDYGRGFANDVLQRVGYTGVKGARNEFAIFNPEKHLLPRFEKPIEVKVTGSVLDSLRTKGLATKSKNKLIVKDRVRSAIDNFDAGARASRIPLTTQAADFTSFLRSQFGHAAPRGPAAYFDPRLPERLHDFVLKHFGSAELANEYESALVRARAAGNVPRIQKLEGRLQSAYYRKYSIGPGSPIEDDPFSPILESEAGSIFHFPAGNKKPIENPFDRIAQTASGINKAMNKLAGAFRRIIIISPSLFYKHAVGDTMRRIAGGDSDIFGAGMKETRQEIASFLDANPKLERRWGTFLHRTESGEANYLVGPEQSKTFSTGQHLRDSGYMTGAGATVRQMLMDDALSAYRKSSVDDLSPLEEMIMSNPTYRRLWSAQQRLAAEKAFGKETVKEGKRQIGEINPHTMQRVVRVQSRKEMLTDALPINKFAEAIFNRYGRVEEAAQAADTSLEDARTIMRANRGGKVDRALGKWISDNKLDFQVKALVPSGTNDFDLATQKMVRAIMSPNKFNRSKMAENIATGVYRDLRAAGWRQENALETAMSIAEKQTVYHMLDFTNMLQIEQDLRWLVFFGTKHRLYWKWVASTMVRQPGAAAVVDDLRQHMNAKGNLDLDLFGHKLEIPTARLVWVPGKEYPETSGIASGVGAAVATGGNVVEAAKALAGPLGTGIQRNLIPAQMLIKAARMSLPDGAPGHMDPTIDNALSGFDGLNKIYLERAINHFQMDYKREHGHYAPESEAVKHALWGQAASNAWRGNLPLPVYGQNKNDTQKLLDQYMLINNPTKRSAFLDKHPELALQFGVSSDPKTYTHIRNMWASFTAALDQRTAVREGIYQEAKKTGFMTAALEDRRHKADADFNKALTTLKAHDLAWTDLADRREVTGEELGLWGQQLAADPLTNPTQALKKLYPNLEKSSLKAGLPSKLIKDAQRELDLLNDPAWVAKTFTGDPNDPTGQSEARTRKRELLQFIEDFRSYPKDPLGKTEATYLTQHVNTYWKHVEQANAQIKLLGRGAKDTAYAKLRAWKDSQDQPVVIDGIRFPSPIAAAWQGLPKGEYRQRVAALATGSWSHLADYEKVLLGYKPGDGTSQGWEDYQETVSDYHNQYGNTTLRPNQTAYLVQAIDKRHPGFAKDYKFSKLPRIQRFEQLAPYKEMPAAAKRAWDEEIGSNAKTIAKALASKGYRSHDLDVAWKNYVSSDIIPYVDNHPVLKRFLKPYLDANPDFLNSLPRSG